MDATNDTKPSTVQTMYDRSGVPILVHKIDGVIYPAYAYVTENYIERLECTKNFKLRSEDVLMTGYPRSGNHWLFEIVSMLVTGTNKMEEQEMAISNMLDVCPEHIFHALEEANGVRRLSSHFRLTQLSDQLPEVKPRLVYVVRNPKDVLTSLYHFYKDIRPLMSYDGTWEDFFELVMSGEVPYSWWFQHVLALEKFQAANPDLPIHIVCYEKLKQNPVAEIEKLAEFLGCGQGRGDEIAYETSFSKMKTEFEEKKMVLDVSLKEVLKEGQNSLVRKGVVGDWKSHFTVEQNERFDQLLNSTMADSKLTNLVRPYII